MNDPRKHHYVSRAYLTGFADKSNGKLHVFDRRLGKSFSTKPENVGHERDFYRIDKNDVIDDEFTVERELFQRIDDNGLSSLRIFADNPQGADKHSRELAMAYMAAASVRTPKTRAKTEIFIDQTMKKLIEQIFQSNSKFQQFIKYLPEELRDDPDFDLERFRQFGLATDNYDVSVDRNWNVGLPLQSIIPIAQQGLAPRDWSVVQGGIDEIFITSDSPLSLIPSGPVSGPYIRLDSPDTIAIFPVDHKRALLGIGNSATQLGVAPIGVSAINRLTALESHRHVFSSESDFVWDDESGNVIHSQEYLELGAPDIEIILDHIPIPPMHQHKQES